MDGSDSSVMSVKTLASHWRAKTYSALSFDKIFSNEAHLHMISLSNLW